MITNFLNADASAPALPRPCPRLPPGHTGSHLTVTWRGITRLAATSHHLYQVPTYSSLTRFLPLPQPKYIKTNQQKQSPNAFRGD